MNRESSNLSEVVVTGVGLVTPLGGSRDETWARLLNGETGIRPTAEGLEAPVVHFSMNGARSRAGDFAVVAAAEAVRQAGFDSDQLRKMKVGCAVSQSKPILHTSGSHPGAGSPSSHNLSGTSLDTSLLLSSFFGWSMETVIKRHFGLCGPSSNVSSACSTGVSSIEMGRYWIQTNQCEIVLVGAAESSLVPLYRAGFKQMGVLANGRSPEAVCPFDERRSGFAIGEGAAVMVLEKAEFAEKRGHRPLAVLVSTALSHSALDPIRFDPDGTAIARLVKQVLEPQLRPDYINSHGTATKFNDEVETRGIKLALGEAAFSTPVSSTKAATGHLLGAAGAVEAAFCVLALRDQIVPPTIHLNRPDPHCDLDYVSNGARSGHLETAMSLSYGFGGQIGAVLFERYAN